MLFTKEKRGSKEFQGYIDKESKKINNVSKTSNYITNVMQKYGMKGIKNTP
tara:strand:+ start:625 stop:777 length:153 start_codon:yes stop_codon:yes gene_type:complete